MTTPELLLYLVFWFASVALLFSLVFWFASVALDCWHSLRREKEDPWT